MSTRARSSSRRSAYGRRPTRASLLALVLVALVGLDAPMAWGQTNDPTDPPAGGTEFGPRGKVTRSRETGRVTFVATQPGRPLAPAEGVDAGDRPSEAAVAYLTEHEQAFGIAGDELDVVASSETGAGRSVRTQQVVDGVPVLGGELVVNLTPDNEVLSVSGQAVPLGALPDGQAVSRDEAAAAAIAHVADQTGTVATDLAATEPTHHVYAPVLYGEEGEPTLVWKSQVYSAIHLDIARQVLVAADSGEVVAVFDEVHDALNRRICDGANTRSAFADCSGGVLTEGGTYTGGVADVQNAYDFSGQTYAFYNGRWGRDSIDGAGMALKSTVQFCSNTTLPSPPSPPGTFQDPCPYNNATFVPFTPATASQAYYGAGTASDDIVAHEMTHGVTQFESALVYQNESGAINEAMSDVFGEALDLTNGQGTDNATTRWQVGEDSSLGVLRDMENPPGFNDPDKMTSSNWAFGTGDNGGVHTNSGVANKAMFLLTDGQTFNDRTVTPIGLEKAVRVFYEAQTNILTSGSDYTALGNALNQACTNLTGTSGIVAADCTQVNNAVLATEMLTEAAAPDTTITSGPGTTDDPTPTWTFSANRTGATFECSIDGGTPLWSACSGPGGSHTPSPALADGTYTFRVRGRVGADIDPTPATRSVTVSTADVELVSKTDDVDPAYAGETVTYTIRTRNNGPGVANNAVVTDALPSGSTYRSSSVPCASGSANTVTCALGNLVDDQEVSFTVTAAIAPDLVHDNGSPLTISNTATITSDRFDRNTANNTATQTTLTKAKGDLEIVSFAPDAPPAEMIVGEPMTVNLSKVITNHGPSAPMDVRVARTASATSNATVTPTVTSHLEGAVGAEEQRSVDERFEIECTSGGRATFTFTNTIAPDRPDDLDPDPTDNRSSVELTVECIVPVAINLRPGSFLNPINLDLEGVASVAVLTTSPGEYGLPLAVDATQILATSLRFGPEATVAAGGGTPEAHGRFHPEDAVERSDERTRDGDRDAMTHHRVELSGLTGTESQTCVRGRFSGTNVVFQGCDLVTFVP